MIPLRHVASFFDATQAEREAMLALLDAVKAQLLAEFRPAGFNIGITDGAAAGQTVGHLHIHLIARYHGDRPDPRGGVRWVIPTRPTTGTIATAVKSAIEVLDTFENIRRAQRAGAFAPHKPLLILLALARVQRGEPRMVEFSAIDEKLKQLLAEFGPSSAAKSRHCPFWHLATDGHGALWDLSGPRELLTRPAGATPGLGELRDQHVKGGFRPDIDEPLRHTPGHESDDSEPRIVAFGFACHSD